MSIDERMLICELKTFYPELCNKHSVKVLGISENKLYLDIRINTNLMTREFGFPGFENCCKEFVISFDEKCKSDEYCKCEMVLSACYDYLNNCIAETALHTVNFVKDGRSIASVSTEYIIPWINKFFKKEF